MTYPRLLFISLFIVSLSGIGIDLYVPSMPAIAASLHASATLVKLSIPIFLVGFAFGQILFGTLSDIYGRKKLLLQGLTLFIIASLMASFAPNIYWLLACRLLQGAGAASGSVLAKAILTDTLKGRTLSHAFNYMALVWSLGPIIAPIIGGYLQFYFDWRSNFYAYTIYGLLMFLCVATLLEETHKNIIPFNVKEIRNHAQRILTHQYFLGLVILLGLGYAVFLVFSILGPFLVQNIMGYNSIVFGHLAFLVGLAYFIGILLNRYLTIFFEPKNLITLGLAIMISASCIQLLFSFHYKLNLIWLVLPIVIIIVADGLVYPNAMAQCMSLFPETGGIASAIFGSLLTFFTSTASMILSFIHPIDIIPIAAVIIILIAAQFLLYAWLKKE